MPSKSVLNVLIIVVLCVWAYAVIIDTRSDTYDANGVHLIFGSIVGGIYGLSRRNGNGHGGGS